MIIWFALLIPVVFVLFTCICFRRKVHVLETLLPFGAAVLLIGLCKYTTETIQTQDTEYWTGYVVEAIYQEPWTEEWDEWVPEQTDSKGRVTVPGHYEHHVAHHPSEWWLEDSNGIVLPISQEQYRGFVRKFGNEQEEDLWHANQTSWGDGDQWHTRYWNAYDTLSPVTTVHTYENRIQASHSVFRYADISDEEASHRGLFKYPHANNVLSVASILGGKNTEVANLELCKRNALLGRKKQVRMWILLFESPDQQIALDQEAYWQGGNKNEVVLCIGIDKQNKALWAHCFSWTDRKTALVHIRQSVKLQKPLDLPQVVNEMADIVYREFVRKQFADFSYLTVEPPWIAVVITYVLTALVCGGLCVRIVVNEIEQEDNYVYADWWNGVVLKLGLPNKWKAQVRWKTL